MASADTVQTLEQSCCEKAHIISRTMCFLSKRCSLEHRCISIGESGHLCRFEHSRVNKFRLQHLDWRFSTGINKIALGFCLALSHTIPGGSEINAVIPEIVRV